MAKKYTLKGINSDVETCSNCGKTNLKKVMWLDKLDTEGNETGNVQAFGTTCGAEALRISKKNLKSTIDRETMVNFARGWYARGFTISKIVQGVGQRGYCVGSKGESTLIMNDPNNEMIEYDLGS